QVMDALNSERNKPVLSKSTKRDLRRKEQRRIKKARLEGPTIPDADDDQHTAPDSNIGQDNERLDLFYDPKKVSWLLAGYI
ncbi:7404_t:CDS:1, partial [Ambispora leptoticha]